MKLKVTDLILCTSLCSPACPHQVTFNVELLLSYKPSSSRPVEALTLQYLPVIQQQVSVFSSKGAETHFYLKTHVPLCVLQSKTQHFLYDLIRLMWDARADRHHSISLRSYLYTCCLNVCCLHPKVQPKKSWGRAEVLWKCWGVGGTQGQSDVAPAGTDTHLRDHGWPRQGRDPLMGQDSMGVNTLLSLAWGRMQLSINQAGRGISCRYGWVESEKQEAGHKESWQGEKLSGSKLHTGTKTEENNLLTRL